MSMIPQIPYAHGQEDFGTRMENIYESYFQLYSSNIVRIYYQSNHLAFNRTVTAFRLSLARR